MAHDTASGYALCLMPDPILRAGLPAWSRRAFRKAVVRVRVPIAPGCHKLPRQTSNVPRSSVLP